MRLSFHRAGATRPVVLCDTARGDYPVRVEFDIVGQVEIVARPRAAEADGYDRKNRRAQFVYGVSRVFDTLAEAQREFRLVIEAWTGVWAGHLEDESEGARLYLPNVVFSAVRPRLLGVRIFTEYQGTAKQWTSVKPTE